MKNLNHLAVLQYTIETSHRTASCCFMTLHYLAFAKSALKSNIRSGFRENVMAF